MNNPDGKKLEAFLEQMTQAERDMLEHAEAGNWHLVAEASDRFDALVAERDAFIKSKGDSRDTNINQMEVK
jgi:hypothetical protein